MARCSSDEFRVFCADLLRVKKEEVKVEAQKVACFRSAAKGAGTKREDKPLAVCGEQQRQVPKAAVENNVVIVTMPEEEAKKPEVKVIEITG
ncbi:16.9 kDa class I heat shock protein 3-like [Wolffia australiana]